jgi:hypothetical protein
MDYKGIYKKFILDRAQKQDELIQSGNYFERHHILPRSMGGDNSKSNLICLTAGDHYFAHLLLAKTYGGVQWRGVEALINLPGSSKRREVFAKRRWVEKARIESAKVNSERVKGQHASGKLLNSVSEEANQKRKDTFAKKEFRHITNGVSGGRLANGEIMPEGWYFGVGPHKEYTRSDKWLEAIRKGVSKRDNSYQSKTVLTEDALARLRYKNSGDRHYSKKPGYVSKTTGENNSSKRPEVRAKMKETMSVKNNLISVFKEKSGYSGNKRLITKKMAMDWFDSISSAA